MATKNAELAPSVDSSYQNPTAWMDELWGDSQTASSYGAAKPSATENQSKNYLGVNANKADIQLVSTTTDATNAPLDGPAENSERVVFSNRLYEDGFLKAMEDGKPMIIVFSSKECTWCHKLNNETFKSPEMIALQKSGHFIQLDPNYDEDDKGNVANLLEDLKDKDGKNGIERYPTTVVLNIVKTVKPDGTIELRMEEKGRMVGYFDGKNFADNLKKMLPKDAAPAGSSFTDASKAKTLPTA